MSVIEQGRLELPPLVAIVGPTGAGKSAHALTAAQHLNVPVTVCDSVKVYRGLDIGSAKPTPQEQACTAHEMFDLVDPDDDFSAGDYAEQAAAALVDRPCGLVVGGTGLYLRTLAWRMTPDPGADVDPARRQAFAAAWSEREAREPGAAHRELAAQDPAAAAEIHPNNQVRVVRALWLCECGGGPVSELRARQPPMPRARLCLVVVDPGVGELDQRIEQRLEAMLAAGWLAEVEKLRSRGYDARLKSMTSLGYSQLLEVVEGRAELAQARAEILSATRRYARRQRTYFRHQLEPDTRIELRPGDPWPRARVDAFLTEGTP